MTMMETTDGRNVPMSQRGVPRGKSLDSIRKWLQQQLVAAPIEESSIQMNTFDTNKETNDDDDNNKETKETATSTAPPINNDNDNDDALVRSEWHSQLLLNFQQAVVDKTQDTTNDKQALVNDTGTTSIRTTMTDNHHEHLPRPQPRGKCLHILNQTVVRDGNRELKQMDMQLDDVVENDDDANKSALAQNSSTIIGTSTDEERMMDRPAYFYDIHCENNKIYQSNSTQEYRPGTTHCRFHHSESYSQNDNISGSDHRKETDTNDDLTGRFLEGDDVGIRQGSPLVLPDSGDDFLSLVEWAESSSWWQQNHTVHAKEEENWNCMIHDNNNNCTSHQQCSTFEVDLGRKSEKITRSKRPRRSRRTQKRTANINSNKRKGNVDVHPSKSTPDTVPSFRENEKQQALILALSKEDRRRFDNIIQLKSNQITEAVKHISIPSFEEILKYTREKQKQLKVKNKPRSLPSTSTKPEHGQESNRKVKRMKCRPTIPPKTSTAAANLIEALSRQIASYTGTLLDSHQCPHPPVTPSSSEHRQCLAANTYEATCPPCHHNLHNCQTLGKIPKLKTATSVPKIQQNHTQNPLKSSGDKESCWEPLITTNSRIDEDFQQESIHMRVCSSWDPLRHDALLCDSSSAVSSMVQPGMLHNDDNGQVRSLEF